MTTISPTPGDWIVGNEQSGIEWFIEAGENLIATCWLPGGDNYGEMVANAHLIGVAPKLKDALAGLIELARLHVDKTPGGTLSRELCLAILGCEDVLARASYEVAGEV